MNRRLFGPRSWIESTNAMSLTSVAKLENPVYRQERFNGNLSLEPREYASQTVVNPAAKRKMTATFAHDTEAIPVQRIGSRLDWPTQAAPRLEHPQAIFISRVSPAAS